MFSAIIVSPDSIRQQIVQGLAVESQLVLIHRICSDLQSPYEIVRALNTVVPDIVFLDVRDREAALASAVMIHEAHPAAVIIGLASGSPCAVGPGEGGIVSILPTQVDALTFTRVLEESLQRARGSPQDNLLAFLPAKAGSGCSTVVLHTGFVLSNVLKKKILVIEGDLRSGVLSILLNCAVSGSVQGALRMAPEIDSFKLEQSLTRVHGIDLLLSSNALEGTLPSWYHYFQLLDFVRSRYDWILVDLPELVNPATAEVVRRAQRVFVVCTQEIPSLKLAERRCQDLVSRGVQPERTRLILNRWHKTELGVADVEKFLDHQIEAVIPNDYRTLRETLLNGTFLPDRSAPGKAILEFACGLANEVPHDSRRPKLPDQLLSLIRRH